MPSSVAAQASYLLFNFSASVGVIFVNKALFSTMHFKFTTLLTALHYVVTLGGLELLAACGVYEKRRSPTTPRMLVLALVVGTAPALNNLSLSLNNLGFYQVVKLLVTPVIVGLEYQLYGASMSARRALALGCVCLGVGAAVVNDLSISAGGLLASLCWVPVAALYKVLWSRVAKEEAWHTLALMRRVLPLSTAILLALMPLIDPPGLGEYRWTPRKGALLCLSGVAAFFVNWSGFLVMGGLSALSHTVLGQLKACLVILGGWLLFGQAYPAKATVGASVAVASMIGYTRLNLHEQRAAERHRGGVISAEDRRDAVHSGGTGLLLAGGSDGATDEDGGDDDGDDGGAVLPRTRDGAGRV